MATIAERWADSFRRREAQRTARRQSREASSLDGVTMAAEPAAFQEDSVQTDISKFNLAIEIKLKANPNLTRAQAYVAALEEHPNAYPSLSAHAPEQERQAVTTRSVASDAVNDAALNLAIAEELKANPSLSKEQAMDQALLKNPSLYTG
jgi:hypothetical protein